MKPFLAASAIQLAAAWVCILGLTGCRIGQSQDLMERFAPIARMRGSEYVNGRDAFLAAHAGEILALDSGAHAPASDNVPDFLAILKCRASHPQEAATFTGLLSGEDSGAWNHERRNPRPTSARIAFALGKFDRSFSPLGEEFLFRLAGADTAETGYPGTRALALWYREKDPARGRQALLQSIREDTTFSSATSARIDGLKILEAREAMPEVKRIYRGAKNRNLKWMSLDFLAVHRDPEIRKDILVFLADTTLAELDRDFLAGSFLAYQDGDYQAKHRAAYPLLPDIKSRKRLLENVSLRAPADVEAWTRLAADEPDKTLKAEITRLIAAFRKKESGRQGGARADGVPENQER